MVSSEPAVLSPSINNNNVLPRLVNDLSFWREAQWYVGTSLAGFKQQLKADQGSDHRILMDISA